MEKHVYRNLKKNWHYLHPVGRLITNADYFLERFISKVISFAPARNKKRADKDILRIAEWPVNIKNNKL